MLNKIREIFEGKSVLILGYGLEGKSSYKFLDTHFPGIDIGIADKNVSLSDKIPFAANVMFHGGMNYLSVLNNYDLILKSPGVKLPDEFAKNYRSKIQSQTNIFLNIHRDKTIGITGTKGKSTTASLCACLLGNDTFSVSLIGNIGNPPFDSMLDEEIDYFVFELSAHQLEFVTNSPHIAVLLNVFAEHLDYFSDISSYTNAKLNIARYQRSGDTFIFNKDTVLMPEAAGYKEIRSERIAVNPDTLEMISKKHACQKEHTIQSEDSIYIDALRKNLLLLGHHNLFNTVIAAKIAEFKCRDKQSILLALSEFRGLKHRLESIGLVKGVIYYNDSISTVPESTIMAVESLGKVHTLLLGGYDRGIDYYDLIEYVYRSDIKEVVFFGPAGKRMASIIPALNDSRASVHRCEHFKDAVNKAIRITPKKGICLLSPAASSYDEFKNFAERGNMFKELVMNSKED